MATNIPASELRDNFSEAVNRVAYGGERLILERHGKPAAALVSMEDLELLQTLEDRLDGEAALRVKKEARERGEKTVTLAEAKRLLEL